MIENDLVKWINELIRDGELWKFYKSEEWIRLKSRVLTEQHHECQICKRSGIVTRYDEGQDGKRKLISTVHHVNHVRAHPDLALSRYYTGRDGEWRDNLIAICKKCHNRIHDRTFAKAKKPGYTNEERW